MHLTKTSKRLFSQNSINDIMFFIEKTFKLSSIKLNGRLINVLKLKWQTTCNSEVNYSIEL